MSPRARPSPQVLWHDRCELAEQDCACAAEVPRLWSDTASSPRSAETDCACPNAATQSGTWAARGSTRWLRPVPLYRASLPGGNLVAFNPVVARGPAVLDGAACRVLDAFAVPRTSGEASALLPDIAPAHLLETIDQLGALGLLASSDGPERVASSAPSTLTAWLHVIEHCNLNCVYCYAPRNGRVMTAEVGRSAVGAVFRAARAHGLRTVKLKYAGGEPTLNIPVVTAIHNLAQELAAAADLELQEVLLSNGVSVSLEMLQWMRREGIRLAVSLDGLGPAHDEPRASPSGGSPSARAVQTIDRALDLGLRPQLSVTVTDRNVDVLSDVALFALERDLLFNLNFVRPRRGDQPLLAPGRLIAGVREVLSVLEERLPARRLLTGLLDRCVVGVRHGHPCGAGGSYLVIDPRGQLACCQMEMGDTLGAVWEGDPLQRVRSAWDESLSPAVDARTECAGCVWRYWCAGGCPLLTRRVEGRVDVRSPYCEVYRALLPELVRLEGLRLVRWQSHQV